MPVHDWTQVEAGIFHAFHVAWIPQIQQALNGGLLPDGYYALAEQHAGRTIADVLALHASPAPVEEPPPLPPATGGTALAEAPPRVRYRRTIEAEVLARTRSLAIRHVSGHRLVALLEIVSPANKDRARHVEDLAAKAVNALNAGVNVLLIDLLPPGPHDTEGLHGAVCHRLEEGADPDAVPADEPLTLVSYVAGPLIEVFLERVGVGAALPAMPLFVRPDRYVSVPLEETYRAAYEGMPRFWRDVLEGRPPGER